MTSMNFQIKTSHLMCAPLPTLEKCMANLKLVPNHITNPNSPKQDSFLVHLWASFEQVICTFATLVSKGLMGKPILGWYHLKTCQGIL
jgi:hypothetical protein